MVAELRLKMVWRVSAVAQSFLLVLCFSGDVLAKGPPDNRVEALELSTVTREVDLTSPLVKQKVTMVLENKGSKAISVMLYTVESPLVDKLAYINAQVRYGVRGVHLLGGNA